MSKGLACATFETAQLNTVQFEILLEIHLNRSDDTSL